MDTAGKPFVLQARAETGADIEWRDTPDDKMPESTWADHGSVWSEGQDLSDFWAVYYRLRYGEHKI